MSDCIPGFETEHNGQIYAVCNLVDRWTLNRAIGDRTEVQIEPSEQTLVQRYPLLKRILNGNQWELFVETERGVVVLKPLTIAWVDPDGNRSIGLSTDLNQTLALEFAFQPAQAESVRSIMLWLQEAPNESLILSLEIDRSIALIDQINTWLTFYSRDLLPRVINADQVAYVMSPFDTRLPPDTATASGQMRLVQSCLTAFKAIKDNRYRERAIQLASALVDWFYQSIPLIGDTLYYPQEWLYWGTSNITTQKIFFAQNVYFTNGVGQINAPGLTQVYKVYEGQLASQQVDAPLIEGRSYPISYWIDHSNQQVSPETQTEEIIEPQGDVIYGSAQDARLMLSYSIFPYAILV